MKNLRYLAALALACALSGAQASAVGVHAYPSQATAARPGDGPAPSVPIAGAPLSAIEWLMLTGGMGLLGAARRRREAV